MNFVKKTQEILNITAIIAKSRTELYFVQSFQEKLLRGHTETCLPIQ